MAPPAFGGTPTILGRYLKLFPKNSYFFLADPLTKSTPHVSKLLPCKYYFFDGSTIDGKSVPKTKKEKKKTGMIYKETQTNFQRLVYVIRYLAFTPFDLIQLIRTVYSAYKAGRKVVKKEKPSHVLGVSDSGPALIVSLLLSRSTKIPYSVFLLDLYKGHFFTGGRLLASFLLDKKIIKNAHKLFVAGEGIGEHYKKRYNKRYITIPNPCEIPAKAPKARRVNTPMKVVYTGMYYWAQKDAIERFQKATKTIPWAKFDIYSYDATRLGHRGLSLQESIRMQRRADVLLLPLSFHPKIFVFGQVIRTAPTGKLPEYLSSGVPILVHAPKYAWISNYLRENNAAVVIDKASEEAIREGLKRLKNHKLRKKLVKNAFALAQKNHKLKKNSRIFYKELLGGL